MGRERSRGLGSGERRGIEVASCGAWGGDFLLRIDCTERVIWKKDRWGCTARTNCAISLESRLLPPETQPAKRHLVAPTIQTLLIIQTLLVKLPLISARIPLIVDVRLRSFQIALLLFDLDDFDPIFRSTTFPRLRRAILEDLAKLRSALGGENVSAEANVDEEGEEVEQLGDESWSEVVEGKAGDAARDVGEEVPVESAFRASGSLLDLQRKVVQGESLGLCGPTMASSTKVRYATASREEFDEFRCAEGEGGEVGEEGEEAEEVGHLLLR